MPDAVMVEKPVRPWLPNPATGWPVAALATYALLSTLLAVKRRP
jgi:hypothetical protein